MASNKKVNMVVFVAHAMPDDITLDPYIVGVFTSYEAAEEAIDIEKCQYTEPRFTFDVTKLEVNRIDAHKLKYVEGKN